MTKRQRRTLGRIFERPTRPDIRWAELETLMRALGADEHQGSGSRVRFVLSDGSVMSLHRPHPRSELPGYAVEYVRGFLAERGIEPSAAQDATDEGQG